MYVYYHILDALKFANSILPQAHQIPASSPLWKDAMMRPLLWPPACWLRSVCHLRRCPYTHRSICIYIYTHLRICQISNFKHE